MRERVARGVRWLDEEIGPEWLSRIRLEWLDLSNASYCVLGQLYGDYHACPQIEALDTKEMNAWATSHGFLIDDTPVNRQGGRGYYVRLTDTTLTTSASPMCGDCYGRLTDIWCETIQHLRTQGAAS